MPTTLTSRRRWASLDDAAQYLGVSNRTFRRYIADGVVPAYRTAGGRLIRVDLNDLDDSLRPVTPFGGNAA